MENPFGDINLKLNKIERLILNLADDRQSHRRIVGIDEYSEYTGLAKATIYRYFSEGRPVPGAFKPKGTKKLFFNLDKYDAYIEEAELQQDAG